MTDILSYGAETAGYKNYEEYVAQQKEDAKNLLAQGVESLAEGSPLFIDTARNIKRVIDVGRKLYKQSSELGSKLEGTAAKAQAKVEEGISKAQAKVEETASKMQKMAAEAPKEVEMKTFKTQPLEEVAQKRPTTFTAAGEQPESKTMSQYLRQKVDELREGRTRAKYSETLDRDPEDIYSNAKLIDARTQAVMQSREQFNPATRQYESLAQAPESVEQVGKEAIAEASKTLKAGVEGVQSAAEATAKEAAQTVTTAAERTATAATEATEALTTGVKTAAEQVGKEAAATASDLALEALGPIGEIAGTGLLLYQGIKDIFEGSRTPRPIAMAAPSFTPGVAGPL